MISAVLRSWINRLFVVINFNTEMSTCNVFFWNVHESSRISINSEKSNITSNDCRMNWECFGKLFRHKIFFFFYTVLIYTYEMTSYIKNSFLFYRNKYFLQPNNASHSTFEVSINVEFYVNTALIQEINLVCVQNYESIHATPIIN